MGKHSLRAAGDIRGLPSGGPAVRGRRALRVIGRPHCAKKLVEAEPLVYPALVAVELSV